MDGDKSWPAVLTAASVWVVVLISASEEGVLVLGLDFSPQPAANPPGMQKCTDVTCGATSGSGYM